MNQNTDTQVAAAMMGIWFAIWLAALIFIVSSELEIKKGFRFKWWKDYEYLIYISTIPLGQVIAYFLFNECY